MNFNSTNIPSQQVRPLHHNVYELSVSLINPLFSISILPSSPALINKMNYHCEIFYTHLLYKPTNEKLSSNKDL